MDVSFCEHKPQLPTPSVACKSSAKFRVNFRQTVRQFDTRLIVPIPWLRFPSRRQ